MSVEAMTYLIITIYLVNVFAQSITDTRGGVPQWVACLTCNVEVAGSSLVKAPRCFLEQNTLPVLLSTGWFQEQIRA